MTTDEANAYRLLDIAIDARLDGDEVTAGRNYRAAAKAFRTDNRTNWADECDAMAKEVKA